MTNELQNQCLAILKYELVPALGCTEPIAIALACAKARDVLGEFPTSLEILCSGNIIKNVKGVTVPNSKGLKGIGVAAVLGCVGGNADNELEVLSSITDEDRSKAESLLKKKFFKCRLKENVDNLYIKAIAKSEKHCSEVTIVNRHTLITEIKKDNKVIFSAEDLPSVKKVTDKSFLTIKNILDFADNVDTALLEDTIGRQIDFNQKISTEGLAKPYGAQVGRTLLKYYDNSVVTRAKASAAAASDARMGGCSLPVVINSGSGNQGITISLPVLEFAKELNKSQEEILRSLALANLTSIHIKQYIGSLSAFCGAVSAGASAGAAITYLYGGDYDAICRTITNTLANTGGIVCDGAKASCAAKIAAALDSAIFAHKMSMDNIVFPSNEGILQDNIEKTIQSIGYMAKEGMKSTDLEILKIMTEETTF